MAVVALVGNWRIVDRRVGGTGERDTDANGGETEILQCSMTSIPPEMKIRPSMLALAALVPLPRRPSNRKLRRTTASFDAAATVMQGAPDAKTEATWPRG